MRPGHGADRRRFLVVAVHDVTPSLLDDVRYLLDRLDAIGGRPRVLKVIPNHPDGALLQSPHLVELLRSEAEHGSEIVLHGFTHRVAGPLRGPLPRRLRARLFAPDAAEFLSLDRDTMAGRLRAGRAALREAGLAVEGFCAPAWLGPVDLKDQLRQEGFHYRVAMTAVHDLVHRQSVRTAWLGYMGGSSGQERLVALGGRLTRAAQGLFPVVKVFLHPQGARRAPACERILRVVAQLAEHRTLVTYGRLLAH